MVGLTTVTWSATDTAGNQGSAAQNVTVTDLTPPTVTSPADVTVEATGEFTDVDLGSASASDLVDGIIAPSSDNTGPYPVGVTIVTWSATDSSGNTGIAAHTVTVTDATKPAVTPPADISVEATGPTTDVNLGTASATDAVDGPLTPTADNTGPFLVGVTIVTWSATDSAGNIGTATQTVTVDDTTAPTVTPPADVTVEATGEFTSVDLGLANASDLVDGALTPSADDSGPFLVGVTIVTWSATDAAGITGTATQTVTVTDTTVPTVTPPVNITVEATGPTTPVSLGTASATDLVDGPLTPAADNTGPFPLGTTVVTWNATDSAGNIGTATQTVTVDDTTAPTVTPPADVTVEATGEFTSVDLGLANASDLVDGALTPSADDSGPFLVGVTIVTWSATDAAGITGTATQTVTVTDTTVPTVTPPVNITVEATGPTTPVSLGTASATDLVDGPLTPAADNTGPFPLGTTVVTWSATDSAGNTGTATQTVTVTDTTAPAVTPPANITVAATGPTTPVSLGSASASDVVDGSLTPAADSTGPFPVGVTTVTWNATDNAGNTGSATQTVTVNDTTPPTVTPPADVTVPSTGTLTDVDLGTASASDLVDGALTPTADNTGPFPVGTTTVAWSATDNAGNTGTATQDVTVTGVATLHVGDLGGAPDSRKNRWWVTVTVTVHDGGESPLSNATVSGSWSGASSVSDGCTTDGNGQCSIESAHVHKKYDGMTFTVTDVSHAPNSYVAAYNHDPDGDSDGGTITVNKP